MNRRTLLACLSALVVSPSIFAAKKKKGEKAVPKQTGPSVIDQEKCIHCGTCFKNCPVKAISVEVVDEVNVYTVEADKCIMCGLCIKNCPQKAISWVPAATEEKVEPEKVEPKK